MNTDERLDQLLGEVLDASAPSRPPDRLEPETLRALRGVRRMPRWFALIKENPMRTNSHVVVGSPTARAATLLAATLLSMVALATAGIAGSRLLAAGPIIVAQDGSGDVTTVGDAVAIADDGDTIVIRPGTYVESVLVTEAITIRGEGDRDSIVIEQGQDADTVEFAFEGGQVDLPYSLLLDRADATVAGLSLVSADGVALMVAGGSPLIEDVRIEGGSGSGKHGLLISDASEAEVRRIAHAGWLTVQGGSTPVIEASDLTDTCLQVLQQATAGAYVGNTISGCPGWGWAIDISGSTPLFEGNTIGIGGIDIYGTGDTHPVIRDNDFEDNGSRSIDVGEDATATIEGNRFVGADAALTIVSPTAFIRDNRFSDNATAITLTGSDATVEGNTITGGRAGIVVTGGSPSLVDNSVEGASEEGISLRSVAAPTLMGNRSCDNGENLHIAGSDEAVVDETNEICTDAAPASDSEASPSGRVADDASLTIGYVSLDDSLEFVNSVTEGVIAAADNAGVALVRCDSRLDRAGVISCATEMRDRGADGVITFQAFEDLAGDACDAHGGLPTVALDIVQRPCQIALVGADNHEAGRLGGQAMGRFARDRWDCAIDAYISLESETSVSANAARMDGYREGFREHCAIPIEKEHVLITSTFRDRARDLMSRLLTEVAGDRIVIVGLNEPAVLGARDAVSEAGRGGDAVFSGQGADPEARQVIACDPDYIASVGYFPERYGDLAVPLLVAHLRGEPIPDESLTAHQVIDASNVRDIYPGTPSC